MKDAREQGYRVAAMEIANGIASYVQAKERGRYVGDQNSRIDWDQGYEAAVCAYRLGHDLQMLIDSEFYDESHYAMAHVVFALLDGTWSFKTRPDPRRKDL